MAETLQRHGNAGSGNWVVVGVALTGLLAAGACAARQPPAAPEPPADQPGTPADPPAAAPVAQPTGQPTETPTEASTEAPLVGLASWYGVQFHGRRAADGSRYNMYEFTAAHRTLEFGTRVRVINLENNRSVEVTITDRGPFVDERIIDVSFAAAQRLGIVGQGVSRVRLEVLD